MSALEPKPGEGGGMLANESLVKVTQLPATKNYQQ